MIPITPRTAQHFCDWCKEYQFNGTCPHIPPVRFSIGIYQITQGMSWHIASPVRWQSFCSASMHFTMAAYAHGIDPAPWLPETLAELPSDFPGWDTLLLRIGKAQQQVFYALSAVSGSTRASRFSRDKLGVLLYDLIRDCFAFAPPEYREQGCFDEMKILLGDLPIKP